MSAKTKITFLNNIVTKQYRRDLKLYFFNEITCLQLLRKEYISKYYDNYPFPVLLDIDESNLSFKMNYCGVTLQKNVKFKPNKLHLQLKNVFFNLKKCNILYKDIHPENICINSLGNIYFIDFEVAFLMNFEEHNNVLTFDKSQYKWSTEYYNSYYEEPEDINIFNNLNSNSEKREWKGNPWSIVRMVDN